MTTLALKTQTPEWCPSCGGPHRGIDLCPSCFEKQVKTDYCLICGCFVRDNTCLNMECARQDLRCRQEGIRYSSLPPKS